MHRVAQASALWGDTPARHSNSAALCRFRPSGTNGIYDSAAVATWQGMLADHSEEHFVLVVRSIIETEGNARAMVALVLLAVSARSSFSTAAVAAFNVCETMSSADHADLKPDQTRRRRAPRTNQRMRLPRATLCWHSRLGRIAGSNGSRRSTRSICEPCSGWLGRYATCPAEAAGRDRRDARPAAASDVRMGSG